MMLEAYEFDPDVEIYTVVNVTDPVVGKEGFRYVITYTINLETNDPSFTFHKSTVKRNFSDFYVLRSLLSIQHPLLGPYALPPKSLNPFIRPSTAVVEIRRKGLEKFLREILTVPVYLSNKGFHLFLQSMLPMSVIVPLVTGKCPRPRDLDLCSIDSESLKEMRCPYTSSLTKSMNSDDAKDQENAETPIIEVPSSMLCARNGDNEKYVQVCVPQLHCPDTVFPRCVSEASMVQSHCHSVDSGMNSGSFPGVQTVPDIVVSHDWLEQDQDDKRTSDNDSCLTSEMDIKIQDNIEYSAEKSICENIVRSIEEKVKTVSPKSLRDEGVADLV